ncbi:uncharacterized protein BJ171DRAFT_500964, partial [Polychytrium aggregatum]|uniref:uncharacterized protein n=1 Tax=Polychytrium aggregatum TaxID=110093 RepID=UPI0022FDF3FC
MMIFVWVGGQLLLAVVFLLVLVFIVWALAWIMILKRIPVLHEFVTNLASSSVDETPKPPVLPRRGKFIIR